MPRWIGLSKNVNKLITIWHKRKLQSTMKKIVGYRMTINPDMFSLLEKNVIVCNLNYVLIVGIIVGTKLKR